MLNHTIIHLWSTQIWHVFYKGSHSFTCYQTPAIPAFTHQPQIITPIWLVLIAPIYGGMARLSWPGWLVTYRDWFRTQDLNPDRLRSPIPLTVACMYVCLCSIYLSEEPCWSFGLNWLFCNDFRHYAKRLIDSRFSSVLCLYCWATEQSPHLSASVSPMCWIRMTQTSGFLGVTNHFVWQSFCSKTPLRCDLDPLGVTLIVPNLFDPDTIRSLWSRFRTGPLFTTVSVDASGCELSPDISW